VATGAKLANPDLTVWVVTGDGDALSIGGNHLLHALRRNVDLKILLFNNRIYGLTKGQYSPTSENGKVTKSTPYGSLDQPVNPISLALAAEATFVARTADIYIPHMKDMLTRAALHKGSVFIEILQNCVIFNDGAFKDVTDRAQRDDQQVMLEHGKPLVFGKGQNRGLRLKGMDLEVVPLGKDQTAESNNVLVYDETLESQTLAYMLSRLDHPVPMGIFRAVNRPTLNERTYAQIEAERKRKGPGDLNKLLRKGEVWTVN
jgi:2-oxoglutarate ferredoxin oxidoreductase subunit beta